MSAAMQYAATSDAQKGFTASGVDSSSYRFLMTFSSVVRLMTFPWFNLAQWFFCLFVYLEVLQNIAVIWTPKIVIGKKKKTRIQVT